MASNQIPLYVVQPPAKHWYQARTFGLVAATAILEIAGLPLHLGTNYSTGIAILAAFAHAWLRTQTNTAIRGTVAAQPETIIGTINPVNPDSAFTPERDTKIG